ncbi:MAG TPA: dockerin type I domain-containing protein [Sedimentisphaerales bacterium]|nr:dockerin type I domain-containing protein [Sedimentisphaerales bacterium]
MLDKKHRFDKKAKLIFTLLVLVVCNCTLAGPDDFNIDGVFEVALDLPRILFLLKRDPNGLPLLYEGNFELNWAFLDTGASGILLSRETADLLDISIHPDALYADVGIGGLEFFDVSEALYIGTDDFQDPDPNDPEQYILSGPYRLQINQTYAGDWPDEPLDILGMPVMAGKTVVVDAGATNRLEYFSANILQPNDPAIPEVDFVVPLRFEKYIMPKAPENIPPLPVLAYNPVIDNVTARYGAQTVTGTWVLDTCGTISLISGPQAAQLGLTDTDANPIITPDFILPIGGIGEDVNIAGYQIDELIIPTLSGYNLIFQNARIGVANIEIIDEFTGAPIILDGIFGSNFLCASAKLLDGWLIDLAATAFEKITIDTRRALLGFDVNDIYPLPACHDSIRPYADLTGDCKVGSADLYILTENWLRNDCGSSNDFCSRADIDKNGSVNFADYTLLAKQWRLLAYYPVCGIPGRLWPQGDLNHDCAFDMRDLQILAQEWLNTCSALNYNCRAADTNSDNTFDFSDWADFAALW